MLLAALHPIHEEAAVPDPVARTYPQGVTCWVDLETPDATAVVDFYSGLLGWRLEDAMPPALPGHYLIASLRGEDAAAIASGAASIGTEAAWNTYIAVDEVETIVAAVERAGGRVVAGPTDTPGGRTAVCADPQDAPFRLWQAGRRVGAQVANEPGAWNFSDLRTTDGAAAARFYGEVFGWRVADLGPDAGGFIQVPGYGEHLAASADPQIFERQRAVGTPDGFADAIGAIQPAAPGEAAHWHVTFTVADREAALEAVRSGGGRVDSLRETMWAQAADVRDPAGAAFSVSRFTRG